MVQPAVTLPATAPITSPMVVVVEATEVDMAPRPAMSMEVVIATVEDIPAPVPARPDTTLVATLKETNDATVAERGARITMMTATMSVGSTTTITTADAHPAVRKIKESALLLKHTLRSVMSYSRYYGLLWVGSYISTLFFYPVQIREVLYNCCDLLIAYEQIRTV